MATFTLNVVTPTSEFFSGEVEHVRLPGMGGYFGILARHAPMLSMLDVGESKMKVDGKDREFVITGGYAEITQTEVTVIARTAEFPEDIEESRAEDARERAIERIKTDGAGKMDISRAKAALSRALSRLRCIRK